MSKEKLYWEYDIYVLAEQRSANTVASFRQQWAFGFEEAHDEYEYPHFSGQPELIMQSAEPLIQILLKNPTQYYPIYWNNPDRNQSKLRSSMLFFTNDGGLIAGITLMTDNFADTMIYMEKMCASVSGKFAYVTMEEPPPSDTVTFKQLVESANVPKIVNGKTFDRKLI